MTGRPRRRVQNWLFTLAFIVLLVGTVAGFLYVRADTVRTDEERVEAEATRAAAALEAEVRQLASGLGGAAAIVAPGAGADAGVLDTGVFAAFARDLIDRGELSGLSLVAVVEGEPRPEYVLVAAEPGTAAGVAVGADLAADPARADTFADALDGGEPLLTDVVDLVTTGGPGLELVRPLAGPSAETPRVVGFVVAGIPLDDLAETAREAMGSDRELALMDGDELVFGTVFDPRVSTTRVPAGVPGQTWTVAVGPPGGPDLTRAWLVVALGALATAALIALVVSTVGHQRELARTNALLARAEERNRAVQEVAGRLARALSGADIVTALVAHLPAAVEAHSAVIATLDETGKLELLGLDDGGDVRSERFLDLGGADSIVQSVITGVQPAWLSSSFDWRGDTATDVLAGEGAALAVLPLTAEGVVGVLAVSYPRIRIFADDEKDLLQTISLLAARALARGRQYDTEHESALAFQRSALPDDLPAVAGLTVAARYRPAQQRATVGGDWYDVLVLDEHRVVLVVGDVVGHGMVAAAAMGRLRTAFQAIARLSTDPGAMLAALSHQVESIPDSFCTTVVCVVVDLRTGMMSWCRAGHPPPLVLADGRSQLLDQRGLPPLGVVPEALPPVHTRQLERGDVVLLYTDGVIERREESIDNGLRRLGIVAEDLADLEPEELGDALLAAMITDIQTDDLAILVVRFDGSADSSRVGSAAGASRGA